MLWLEPSVAVELRDVPGISEQPRYYPGGLFVDAGPRMDAAEYERYVIHETFGSVDWDSPEGVDEFRFDRTTGLLARLSLRIPEYVEEDPDRAMGWLSVDSARGNLRLIEPKADFYVGPAAVRWCTDRELILLRGGPVAPTAERLRVQVAPGLHLLFADGLLAGWMLDAPESRISPLSGEPSTSPADPVLAEVLEDYLRLMAFPALDDLMDSEPGFRRSLEELAARIDVGSGATDRRSALRDCIDDVIKEWYEE
jgi:hypothetical protein